MSAVIQTAPRVHTRAERLQDILVVDTDVHIHESPRELAPYCEMPWQKSLEVLMQVPERYLDIPSFSPGGGGYCAPFPGGNPARRATSPEELRSELNELSIDIAVLYPDHLLKIALLPQPDYAAALARAYNAWLLDRWCSPERGLLGTIVAVPQAPEETAREIERYAKEPGIVGVYLPGAGVAPLWGNRKYDPIYAAAEKADLPVLLHSVTVVSNAFPWQLEQYDTELARHTVGHPFSMVSNLVSMITSGVPVRYPKLRIGFTEAGIAWVPFILNRLDKEYLEQRRQVPFLENRPSHYIREFFFATQPIEEPEDPQDYVSLVKLFHGETQVMFASDWPHHDFDHPGKLFQMPFPPETKRKLLGENALRFFKINEKAQRLNI